MSTFRYLKCRPLVARAVRRFETSERLPTATELRSVLKYLHDLELCVDAFLGFGCRDGTFEDDALRLTEELDLIKKRWC